MIEIDKEEARVTLCSDCPPIGYPTDETRCRECPRRTSDEAPCTDCEGVRTILQEADRGE